MYQWEVRGRGEFRSGQELRVLQSINEEGEKEETRRALCMLLDYTSNDYFLFYYSKNKYRRGINACRWLQKQQHGTQLIMEYEPVVPVSQTISSWLKSAVCVMF